MNSQSESLLELRTATQRATANIFTSYRILNPFPSSQSIYTLTYNLSQTPVSRQPQPLATISRHTQVVWIAIILC
ncbi:hypothetical protein I312_104938 [Cryptococcus bacillisporus CA1280]|uniref:uncharacterized protein n=1 Tax=Cryptococcus bacillisporus CA1280 TaxID=1296109 RepID=UPI0033669085